MMEEVRECLIVNQEIPKFQVWKVTKQATFWSQRSQKETRVKALNRKSQADKWGRGNYTNHSTKGKEELLVKCSETWQASEMSIHDALVSKKPQINKKRNQPSKTTPINIITSAQFAHTYTEARHTKLLP